MGIFFYHILNVGLEHFNCIRNNPAVQSTWKGWYQAQAEVSGEKMELCDSRSCEEFSLESLRDTAAKTLRRLFLWPTCQRESSKTELCGYLFPPPPPGPDQSGSFQLGQNCQQVLPSWSMKLDWLSCFDPSSVHNQKCWPHNGVLGSLMPTVCPVCPLGTKESAVLGNICQLALWSWEMI